MFVPVRKGSFFRRYMTVWSEDPTADPNFYFSLKSALYNVSKYGKILYVWDGFDQRWIKASKQILS